MPPLTEILQEVLPPQFNITKLSVLDTQGDRAITEEKELDVDIRVPGKTFPDNKQFWVTQIYVDVTGQEIVLSIWMSADMHSTAVAEKNLGHLCAVGRALQEVGMREKGVQDRPDIFAWEVTTNEAALPSVVRSVLNKLSMISDSAS